MFNKEYAISSFKFKTFCNEIIEDSGSWSESAWNGPRFDINYSSILTRLIQETGRWCESYASDLFIDWEAITENLTDRAYTGGKYLFGFRQMGVDGNAFVISRLNNGSPREIYRALWLLEVTVEDDKITMKLGKADY